MRTQTLMTSVTLSIVTAGLPLAFSGCGDLTEGGPSASPGSIGKLMLLSNLAGGAVGEAVDARKRVVATTGTGTIGPVTVTYYELHDPRCDSPIQEVANLCAFAPDDAAIGPDGAPWFTRDNGLMRVGDDDAAVQFPMSHGTGVLASGGGMFWGLSWQDNTPGIVRFDPGTGASDFYAVPGPLSRPTAVTVDGHGDVYVTGGDRNVVGRIDAHHNVYVVAQEESVKPVTVVGGGLAVSAAGWVYVSDYSSGRVGRVNGHGFQWTDLGGDEHAPSTMMAAPDGSVWFVDLGSSAQVGRIDATGTLQTFALPDELQLPDSKSFGGLGVAPDGAVWFTVPQFDKVVRVTATGEVSYVSLEEHSLPRGLAIDAKGRVWVTTMGVARIDLGS